MNGVFPVRGIDWQGGYPGYCLPSSDFGSHRRKSTMRFFHHGLRIVLFTAPDLVEVKGMQDFGLGK